MPSSSPALPSALLPAVVAATFLAACAHRPAVHPRAAEQVRRGHAHLEASDLERAEVAFEHALAFDPDFPEALNGLGLVARVREDLPAARRRFERALRLAPDFAEGHANLGEALLAAGERANAEEELRAALRIDPDLVPARQNLARALLRRGVDAGPGPAREEAWTDARRELLHLLEAAPACADAHHDLAYLDHARGRYDRAEAGYRRAAELAPSSPEALHGLCVSLVRLGRCGEAAAACERCLAVAPGAEACATSLRGARACAAR
jgi:Flp pilus assembly protein TadD